MTHEQELREMKCPKCKSSNIWWCTAVPVSLLVDKTNKTNNMTNPETHPEILAGTICSFCCGDCGAEALVHEPEVEDAQTD